MGIWIFLAIVFSPLWMGVLVVAWDLIRGNERDSDGVVIPPEKIRADRLSEIRNAVVELEKWNTEWVHPELGNFYHWDSSERKYLESSASTRARGNCVSCGGASHVRDRSTGFVSFCYPCFNTSRVVKTNFTLIDSED